MIKVKKTLLYIRRTYPLYLMMLPGALYLLINNYFPISGLVVAFKDYDYGKGIWGSDWAGLENFEFLFKNSTAWVQFVVYRIEYGDWRMHCDPPQ